MDTMLEANGSNQGLSSDERKYLSQIFDNVVEDSLAVSEFSAVQILREGRKQ